MKIKDLKHLIRKIIITEMADVQFKSLSDAPEKWQGLTQAWARKKTKVTKTKTFGDYGMHFIPIGPVEGEIQVIDKFGNVVGKLFYGKENEHDDYLKGAVEVAPDHRRKGIGTALYTWAEKLTGMSFQPDTPHTPLAAALWSQPNRPFGNR